MNPLVSILMPVYNGEEFLKEAIDSILNQTYKNFEFIIINDGSTDSTEDIILSYNDKRIRYFKNSTNIKLIATLNKGLTLCQGKYIARMDADDVALPQRLEKQVVYFENHPEVGVLGSWVQILDLKNNRTISFLQGNSNIRLKLFFNNYLHHPTVMLRNSVIQKHHLFYPKILHTEDYAFWILLAKYTKFDIYPEILLQYRIHNTNISILNQTTQKKHTSLIRLQQINALGIFPNQIEFSAYENFIENKSLTKNEFLLVLPLITSIISESKTDIRVLLYQNFKKKVIDFVNFKGNLDCKIFLKYTGSIFNKSILLSIKLFAKLLIQK